MPALRRSLFQAEIRFSFRSTQQQNWGDVMKRNFAIVVAVAALALLPFRAFAANVLNETVPLSGSVSNTCNGDTVSLSGTEHLVVNETFDSNGGAHASISINAHLTGTGTPSGDSYVGNLNASFNENANSGGTITGTEPISFEIISQGSDPNLIIKALFHITINPDGTVTSYIDTYTADCRG